MQKPIPILPRHRQPSPPNVKLQRLVNEPRLRQPSVPLVPPLHELGLGRARLEVLVAGPLLGHSCVRHGVLAPGLPAGRVVVAGVDLEVVWEGEELGRRVVEEVGVAVGEIAARGANVGVEEGVAAEDVCWVSCE